MVKIPTKQRSIDQAARLGDFKVALVWALDRLTREGVMQQFSLMHRLAKYGVRVYSMQEPWTEQPDGDMHELLLSIYACAAKSESDRRSARTKAGMQRVREKGSKSGKPIGRPRKE